MTNKFINKSSQREFYYKPIQYYKYFQLCMFKHPSNQKHHIRRLIIDSNSQITEIKELFISNEEYQKLLSDYKVNEYKIYPAYDLTNIDLPSGSEINILQSPILTNSNLIGQAYNNYNNYAKF